MVSRKNIKYKAQQDAKRVPHYGIRKLSIGVASVLLGTVFYMQNGNAYADVNPTVNAGNESVNVVNKDSGTSGLTGASNTSTGGSSASSVVLTGNTTNSTTSRQVSGSPAEGATKQVNNAASEPGSVVPASQVNTGTDKTNAPVPNRQTGVAGNPSNERLSDNLALSSNQNSNFNFSSLLASKVALTGTSNNAVNGGFDQSTWGTLDVSKWTGQENNGIYELTGYTGDLEHIIVPNSADFAKAGRNVGQVGISADTTHSWFVNGSPKSIAFSKTDGQIVKAVGSDWTSAFTGAYDRSGWYKQYAHELILFDGINLDTSNIINMSYMFANNKLTDVSGVSNWKTDSVTNMSSMFDHNQISDLAPLANWKTDSVTNMSRMFDHNQISDLAPLANWKTDNITDMNSVFMLNNQISDLAPLANWRTDNVMNMSYMFAYDQISDLAPLSNWKTDNVTNMNDMFDGNQISDLSSLSNWKTDNVTSMNDMFNSNQISDLSSLSNWKTDNVMDMGGMFLNNQISDLTPISNWKTDNVTNMSYMFSDNQISNIMPLFNWKTDNVTDMSSMFSGNRISDLTPLSNWKTDNVTNMVSMFSGNRISDLTPLSNWKTDNVTNMVSMFSGNRISDLTPLSNWKTDNVTNMVSMFVSNQISDLTPIANWKTDNVTDMSGMFSGNQISYADFTKWDFLKASRLDHFINQSTPAIIIVKNADDQTLLSNSQVISTKQNQLHFGSDTVDMPTVYLASDKEFARKKILAKINIELTEYRIFHANADDIKPVEPLDQLTNLVDLANAKFTVVKRTLPELDTNDAFALDPVNGLHEHKNVNDNGGYDTDFWGTLDVSKFTTVKNGDNLEITGYTGDASKVIIPNIADFELNNLDQGAKQVTISSQVMHQLAKNVTRIGLSKTNNQKVVVGDAVWQDAFGGMTNNPQTGVNGDGGMWVYNPNLTVMDLHNLDTTNITDMSLMFNGGRNLKVVGDLSQWNTANVISMRGMFQMAALLTNIGDLDNWNTAKVTDMGGMFSKATNLTNIGDLSKWDTGNVTDMHYMFANATNLTNIGNLDNWNTSKVTDMHYMFGTDPGKKSHLANIGDLSKWQTGNVTDMNNMFANATDLTNIGNLDNWNTSNVTNMSWMFSVDSDKQSHLTNIGDLSKWNTSKVTNMAGMFSGTTNLTNIGNLDNWDTSNVTNMARMFYNATNLTNIGDLSKWQTGNVTIMFWMFGVDSGKQSHLTNIGDLSKWQTGNVTDMSFMFANAANLTNIGDLSKWNTSKVTDMRWMFGGTTNLTNIGNLDNWDTSNVTNMASMFCATNLTNIGDLSKWQTGNVTNMAYMFTNATHLTNIGDLSKWNTSKVTNMLGMFGNVNALRHLNISNWNLTKLANKDAMKYMFAEDPNLTVIANDLVLPAWYQNEINDADYFWNHHIAVITNVPELIKSTGATDNLKIDDQDVSRSIFYDSKGSSDAIQVLKAANQAYVKQYQNEHPGYTLTLVADVDQTDPIVLANANFISVPREVQFTIAYYDLTGKLVDSVTSTHKVGDNVSISPVAPDNYVLVSGQAKADYLMRWGSNEADFLVEPKVTQTTEKKTVSRTIQVQTPDGQTNNVVQTVKFVRNGYLNQVTKQTTYSPWSFGGQYQFSSYQPKPIDGYTADAASVVIVTPDSSDTTVNVVYHKLATAYSVVYQLANGTIVKNVSMIPESNGMVHLTAPQGYRLLTPVTDMQVGHISQTLAVLVVPAVQTYTAHETLPNTVTEPLTKMVTRTVKITLPNGHVRTVKQSVKFERTVTVDSAGQVTYGNWQAIGRAQFNKVFVPKWHGYHLVITDASGKVLSGVDKIDNVTAVMSDEVVNVKYVKD